MLKHLTNATVDKIGEYALVERIKRQIFPVKYSSRLVIGPGDDAFASRFPPGHLLVATKDLLVENVHFKLGWTSPENLGYKAIAVNISDLAAMGKCVPLYALVGLAVPKKTKIGFVGGFAAGMRKICDKYGVLIGGGDTVSSNNDIVISITMIGAARQKNIIKRSGAKPGDLIYSTGPFGDSGAGLYLLSKMIKNLGAEDRYLINKHLLPEPRVKEAGLISDSCAATSMIDSSDGLHASIRFITKESRVGAKIFMEKVPVSKQFNKFAFKFGKNKYWNMVLTGGEEYELVFTVAPSMAKRVEQKVPGIKCFGMITAVNGIEYYLDNKKAKVDLKAFEHFN